MTSTFLYELCLPVTIYLESETFDVDKGWIAGAFFLGLFIGGGITALLAPICMRDWQKKKRQDEEEAMLIEMEKESAVTATNIEEDIMRTEPDKKNDKTTTKPGKLAFITSRLRLGRKKEQPPAKTSKNVKTGWVDAEDDGKTKQPEMVEQGMVTVLFQPKGNADAELTNQDITAIKKMDKDQKKTKDDMMLKMLKIKLRKMKGKGQITDPYLADFTQKIMDNKRNNEEVLNAEKSEAEDEIRKRLSKNPKAMEEELENLEVNHDLKQNQMEKDEFENIRGELLRTSGLTEAEVDDLLERLKQDLAELERKQGLEQARQARHLAERLEKRRHILEFRKLQEQQNQQEMLAEVHAFEQPIVDNLVKDGKLTEKQKEEILNEHEKNLQNLKKQQDIEAMRMQSDLAEKLKKRRETRMKKLEDKHQRERASYTDKAESGSKADYFINTYQDLIQRQQVETEEVQNELDQTEIQEVEKLNNNLDKEKTKQVQTQTEKFLQTLKQTGQVTDYDVNKIIKLHNARMDEFDAKRRLEKERMKKNLQEKWEQRMMKLEEDSQATNTEKEAIIEQQATTVRRVLDSNLQLSDEAREKILREHERNMEALNNQLARSKLKQQLSLEQKLSQRRARLAEVQSQQELAKQQRRELTDKEVKQMKDKLEQEMNLFEKEKKEAEEALRRRLALETEAALVQQERDLAALIGRLEVGHARRQAVLQKQDKTMKQLQDQLENKLQDGRISANRADQIIQQHYNQVEHINDQLQQNRDRQERLINERIQAKKYKLQRELEDELAKERQELMMARRQAGTGMASAILNNALMEQRQKKAMEELEKEMQIELERNKAQLNSELQLALEKELETHKGDFLNQLAAASKISRQEIDEVVSTAAMDTGRNRTDARKLTKSLTMGVEKAKTSLDMIEEDESDGDYRTEKPRPVFRPRSSLRREEYNQYEREEERPISGKKKKTLQKSKPAFHTSTGEQIHGAWDLDDELL